MACCLWSKTRDCRKAASTTEPCTTWLGTVPRCMGTWRSKKLQKTGEKFISQYLALEAEAQHLNPDDSQTWRAKPKLHVLGHLLDEARKGMHPKDFWNYRDETEGYTFQKL